MLRFQVEPDPIFDASIASIDASINAAKVACPSKTDQLMSHVLTQLGLSMEEQTVISYMRNGNISSHEIEAMIRDKRISINNKSAKKKMQITTSQLKEIFMKIKKEGKIRAANTWQYFTYWLEKNCEGWTGGKLTQEKHLRDVVNGEIEIPKRAFRTHNPQDLKSMLDDPNGKTGSYHYAAVARLQELCIEVSENSKIA